MNQDKKILKSIKKEWSWIITKPKEIIRTNLFGNIILKQKNGEIWRIIPEELTAMKIADTEEGLNQYLEDPKSKQDWEVANWVKSAVLSLGELQEGQCFGFKIWPLLGGEYNVSNIVVKNLQEWIEVSGNVGNQIKNLPDGAKINLEVN